MSSTTLSYEDRHEALARPIGTVVLVKDRFPLEKCQDGHWYMPRVVPSVDGIFLLSTNYPMTVVRTPPEES